MSPIDEAGPRPARPASGDDDFRFPQLACPECRRPLGALSAAADGLVCPGCGRRWSRSESTGTVDFRDLTVAQRRFLEEYEQVRIAEGRGEGGVERARDLPWPGAEMRFAWEWWQRAASYDCLLDVLRARAGAVSLRVLDLGAGVGWLSRRLAFEGHRPLAIDLSDHARVGLGVAARLGADREAPFDCLLADFDRLPLVAARADVVVFNASLHYAPEPASSLREALRVMATGGSLVIMDSPVYRSPEAGRAMVQARRSAFEARYGFASDALGSREYLLESDLPRWAEAFSLRWARPGPRRGWSWRFHRLRRRLQSGRESADLPLLVGRRVAEAEPEAGPGA